MIRYCLVSDGDGHHWLCPVERAREACALLEANEDYWGSYSPSGEPPANPDSMPWLRRVDNPTRLTFADPREDL